MLQILLPFQMYCRSQRIKCVFSNFSVSFGIQMMELTALEALEGGFPSLPPSPGLPIDEFWVELPKSDSLSKSTFDAGGLPSPWAALEAPLAAPDSWNKGVYKSLQRVFIKGISIIRTMSSISTPPQIHLVGNPPQHESTFCSWIKICIYLEDCLYHCLDTSGKKITIIFYIIVQNSRH